MTIAIMGTTSVVCPQCKENGDDCKVYVGSTSKTLVYYQPFFDENGRHHWHDGNKTTTCYSCSNGHSWSESYYGRCWRGWVGE